MRCGSSGVIFPSSPLFPPRQRRRMTEVILIEIVAVPAERSRGRHNPRVVKRKMSNFPTRSCCSHPIPELPLRRAHRHRRAARAQCPTTAGHQRVVPRPSASPCKPIAKRPGRPWFKPSGPAACRVLSTAISRTCHRAPSTSPSLSCARPSALPREQPPIRLRSTVLTLAPTLRHHTMNPVLLIRGS